MNVIVSSICNNYIKLGENDSLHLGKEVFGQRLSFYHFSSIHYNGFGINHSRSDQSLIKSNFICIIQNQIANSLTGLLQTIYMYRQQLSLSNDWLRDSRSLTSHPSKQRKSQVCNLKFRVTYI